MSDEEEYREWVESTLPELVNFFNLQNWWIEIEWKVAEDAEDEGTAASIDIDSRYMRANINVFPPCYSYWNKNKIEKLLQVLVHEFSHTLFDPLYDICWDAEGKSGRKYVETILEQQTQKATVLLMKYLPERFKSKDPNRFENDYEYDQDQETEDLADNGHTLQPQENGGEGLETGQLSAEDHRELSASDSPKRRAYTSRGCHYRAKRYVGNDLSFDTGN